MKTKKVSKHALQKVTDKLALDLSHGLKDTGERNTFDSGAMREPKKGHGRYDLLPGIAIATVMTATGGEPLAPLGIRAAAEIYEAGSIKYADRNWEKGLPLQSFLDSGLRHMYKAVAGMDDEPHLAMALWNFLCFVHTDILIKNGVYPETLAIKGMVCFDKLGVASLNHGFTKCIDGCVFDMHKNDTNNCAGVLVLLHMYTATADTRYMYDAVRMLAQVIEDETEDATTKNIIKA